MVYASRWVASKRGCSGVCTSLPTRRACLWSAVLSASVALSDQAVAEIEGAIPIPEEEGPSEILRFSQTISKLEVRSDLSSVRPIAQGGGEQWHQLVPV